MKEKIILGSGGVEDIIRVFLGRSFFLVCLQIKTCNVKISYIIPYICLFFFYVHEVTLPKSKKSQLMPIEAQSSLNMESFSFAEIFSMFGSYGL